MHANSGLAEALWGAAIRRRDRAGTPHGHEAGAAEFHWPFIEQPRPLAAIAPGHVVDQDANAHMHVRNYSIDRELIARILIRILTPAPEPAA